MRDVIRYSEAFKLQVVREIDEGKFVNYASASRAYGIRGPNTIAYWIKKYGKNHLLNKVVRVEKPNERNEMKKLKERIRKLESALSDTHIDLVIEKEYFKMACEAAGIDDIGEFKKKHVIH